MTKGMTDDDSLNSFDEPDGTSSLGDDSRLSMSQHSNGSIQELILSDETKQHERNISFIRSGSGVTFCPSVGGQKTGSRGKSIPSSPSTIMEDPEWYSRPGLLSRGSLTRIDSYMDRIISLESVMTDNLDQNTPLIFLHPEDQRDLYTDEEVQSLSKRDFQTRLFITALAVQNNSLWLRNHHTDNVKSATNFTYIRDYFKAAYAIKNHTAAKATLTSTLNKWFNLSRDQYYTFATTLASGLSREAISTSFQIEDDLVESTQDLKHARRVFILLMDILFKRIYLKTFLYTDNNSNIYRLAHCMTKNTRKKGPLVYATFSFLLQLSLTIFVLMSNFDAKEETDNLTTFRLVSMYTLATFGFLYTAIVGRKEFLIARSVYRFYGKITVLALLDFFVNLILPTILLFAGSYVIATETSFINAVLNTTAFLLIPEIDDRLPALLNYDQKALIENYLIAESKNAYNKFIGMTKEDIKNKFDSKSDDSPLGVPFNDYYITNDTEEGSNQTNGSLYQPHSVVKNEDDGHEIDPSNYVTKDCLLRSVEWRYTTFNPKTTKPRIGYLKLIKLSGEEVEIKYKDKEAMAVGRSYSIKGVFVITNFVMSCGILNLRLCGSESESKFGSEFGSDSARDFMTALDYYSLWDIDDHARKLLVKDVQYEVDGGGYFQSAKSLFSVSRKRRNRVPQNDDSFV
jgi:hypothetical protein